MSKAERWALLLAPGAGASSDASALVAIEQVVPANIVVRRMDFPYRLAGRRAPDRQPVLVESLVEQARSFSREKRIPMKRMFLGGRSMGGRIASIAAAETLNAAGLVLISYPLHPPGRPEKLRAEHFPKLDLPCLFVSGTKDAFGTVSELEGHTAAIPGVVDHVWLEGGDHGLRRKDEMVSSAVAQWLQRQITVEGL